MDPKIVTPILVTGLVLWAIYRRMRRTFGRQKISEKRIWIRISVLTIVGGLFFLGSLRNAPALGALLAGLICGAALGYLGLRHTQFEVTPEGGFYTPHTYIGLTVSALFLGRVLYRFLALHVGAENSAAANQNPFAGYQGNPLTTGIFGVLLGYYVLFNLGILQKIKTLAVAGLKPAG
ncbi:MAG TPA: hypothetical protein VF848_07630, partial [Steroidobacteraceae bacterium]